MAPAIGFSNSFLFFFHQIALGGLLALSATPFHELDRAFYKSTGGVLTVIAILNLWGKTDLYWTGLTKFFSLFATIQLLLDWCFALCCALYVASLWGENQRLRARSFASAIVSGALALIIATRDFYSAPVFSVEGLIYPLSFFFSALVLGSVTVGMLIGHWYLIDTGQTLDPFIRIFRFFVSALVSQSFFYVVAAILLYLFGASATSVGLDRLWSSHSTLLIIRIVSGQLVPLMLAWMIWRTLLIPHTMAATGLFYIALLGVFVGEILGRQILALTSLPF